VLVFSARQVEKQQMLGVGKMRVNHRIKAIGLTNGDTKFHGKFSLGKLTNAKFIAYATLKPAIASAARNDAKNDD
jgi:hypothetical protein